MLREKQQLINDMEVESTAKRNQSIRIDIKAAKFDRINTFSLDSKRNTPRAGDSIQSAVMPSNIHVSYNNKPNSSQPKIIYGKSKTPMVDDSPGSFGRVNIYNNTRVSKIDKKTAMLNMTVEHTETLPLPAKALTMHQKFKPIAVIDPSNEFTT